MSAASLLSSKESTTDRMTPLKTDAAAYFDLQGRGVDWGQRLCSRSTILAITRARKTGKMP